LTKHINFIGFVTIQPIGTNGKLRDQIHSE
jgi:hypothetical protein